MPFKKIGSENLDTVVNVRLTTAEKDRLRYDAEIASISMSELVRKRYFGRKIIANADAVMLKELRRLGGLLKHVNNENKGIYSKDIISAINTLKKYMEVLTDDSKKNK